MRGARLALGIALVAVAAGGATAADTAPRPPCSSSSRCAAPPRPSPRSRGPSGARSRRAYGAPVDLQVEHLDLPDASVVPYARRLVDLLREKYAGRRVDVVVVEEGQALRFLLENREALFPGVPVVFTDVTRRSVAGLRAPPGRDRGLPGARGPEDGPRGSRPPPRGPPGRARRRLLSRGQGLRGLRPEARRGPKPRAWRRCSLGGLPLDEQLLRLSQLPRRQRGDLRQLPGRLPGPVHGLARRPPPRHAGVERPGLRGVGGVARPRDRGRGPHRLSGPRREERPS